MIQARNPRPGCLQLAWVPAGAHRRIASAFGGQRFRYDAETQVLELPTLMRDVTWRQYETLLAALPEHRLRHTYDQGTLEMMSPSTRHEKIKKFMARLIEAMALDLNISIMSVGSTTRRRKAARRGLEPDESYYVANERLVRGRDDYDPDRDPPPDLVVEVDVRRASVRRMRVYAALGVPEVWQHDGTNLSFHQLTADGAYKRVERSAAFPFLAPNDITRFVDQRYRREENEVVRSFVAWARKKFVREAAPRTNKKKKGS